MGIIHPFYSHKKAMVVFDMSCICTFSFFDVIKFYISISDGKIPPKIIQIINILVSNDNCLFKATCNPLR